MTGRCVTLRRHIQLLYPLEVDPLKESNFPDEYAYIDVEEGSPALSTDNQRTVAEATGRPNRAAAMKARDRIITWMTD